MAAFTRPCQHCGAKVEGLHEDWREVSSIPWCAASHLKLHAILPKVYTREDYVKAHEKVHPGDFRANDNLMVVLGLAPACQCNGCKR